MKGAVGAGVAATGLTAFGGSASAQQNVRNLNLGGIRILEDAGGLVNVEVDVRNVNILRDFDDLTVTVIGGDVFGDEVNVVRDVEVNVNDRVINVELEDIDVDVLTDSVVQVAVAVLGGAGNAAAQGSTLEFVDGA